MDTWRGLPGGGLPSTTTELPIGPARSETLPIESDEPRSHVPQVSEPNSRRRFTIAVLVGSVVAAVPYLWVLFDLWRDSPHLLRTAESNGYASNFYDLQARAMFHGHLYVANGAVSGEAFVHAGRQYTYFGIFPSLLRMPTLAVTHTLDGRLTSLSMLLAWLVTALFSSALLWRVRVLVRGPATLSRTEAASLGVLVATIIGGSVLVFLASDPWVFSEDLAWSVALTVGSMFALLGVLERPSWGRVVASGALVTAANLTRASTGYACVIGAVLVALWFALGRGEVENRRWALPILSAGIVALAIGSAIDYAKFGIFFGLPAADQIVYQVFGLSRLANGSYFSVHFLPSTLRAYFQPGGLRLTPVFPFATLPSVPARSVGHVFFYGTDRTASVPSSMPLLFLASLWGVISTFRPRPVKGSGMLRIVLVAAVVAGGTVMVYGWIENRFVADLLPFLIVASAAGIVDIWRRLDSGQRSARYSTLAIVASLGVFGIAANVAMASTPQSTWSADQGHRYVEFQKAVSNATGDPLAENVMRGNTLPNYAPADRLFVVGRCASLYISDGEGSQGNLRLRTYALLQQLLWFPVELGPGVRHTLDITFNEPIAGNGESVPLLSVGSRSASTISVQPYGTREFRFTLTGPGGISVSIPVPLTVHRTYRITIVTDPYLHLVSITSGQSELLHSYLLSQGPIVVHTFPTNSVQSSVPVTVADMTGPAPDMSLCRSLRS